MKNKIIFSLILIGFLFIGCDPNDPPTTDSLNGTKWIYHQNSENHFYPFHNPSHPDYPNKGTIQFSLTDSTMTTWYDDVGPSNTFYFSYEKPNIKICRGFVKNKISWSGTINGDTMTLYCYDTLNTTCCDYGNHCGGSGGKFLLVRKK